MGDDDIDGPIYGTGGDDAFLIQTEATDEIYVYGQGGEDEISISARVSGAEHLYTWVDRTAAPLDVYAYAYGTAILVQNGLDETSDPGNGLGGTVTFRAANFSGTAENYVYGWSGDDAIDVRAHAGGADWCVADNYIHAGDGNDQITARATIEDDPYAMATNRLWGEGGDDRIFSEIRGVQTESPFRSEVYGGEGEDRISVKGGDGNLLYGNQGDDSLYGSDASDQLIGGQGADYLKGGGGEDAFVFMWAREGRDERDQVADFHIGEDKIDLSEIDANVFRTGDQAFRFSGPDDWHGNGRVWLEDVGKTTTLVHVDTGRTEMTIALLDGRDVHAEDYGAGDFIL
ncbi:M10 family metallopeptidase C-terminal domain-containing protein [Amaricoccus solimangrovi]|uniref:M10 family metallopeptidase C-terminal domain-containing protein n=1 Tax=Amaricoccus solimangrovi TaxID=2589815 RepID=UPI00112E4666|nr:M10 family metallopeptidase C-terminal domain-containing protein [Amaricoccus solimangrovi]